MSTPPSPPPAGTEPRQPPIRPDQITFLQPQLLYRYVTDTGRILPRRITGLCAKHQRELTRTIKRGRNMLTMQ